MAKFINWIRRKIGWDSPPQPVFIQVATLSNPDGSSNSTSTEEAGSQDAPTSKGILELYFGILYRLGLTPSPVQGVNAQTLGWNLFHKVVFGIMSSLAILQSVDGVKYYSAYVQKGNLDHLLEMGFFIVRWCIKILFLLSVTKKWSKAKVVISLANRLEQLARHKHRLRKATG